jgi:hypothetical protein
MKKSIRSLFSIGARLAIFVALFGMASIKDTVGQDNRSGELEPFEHVVYKFDCKKDEICGFSFVFSPKHQRQQGEAECQKFQLMSWVDNDWFNTASGYFKYVEDASGKEVLQCEAYTGYQGGKSGSKDRTFTIKITNGNNWKGLWVMTRRR